MGNPLGTPSRRPSTAEHGPGGNGYAWTMATLAFAALGIGIGVRTSFGLLIAVWSGNIDPREAVLDWHRGEIALAAAIGFLVFGLAQPVIGRLADRFGPGLVFAASLVLIASGTASLAFAQTLLDVYLIFGFVVSIGVAGASMVTATAAISLWFHTRKGVAAGFIIAGGAAGQVVIVPLLGWFVSWWGWRDGLIILSAPIFLLGVVIACVMRGATVPTERRKRSRRLRLGEVFHSKHFWLLFGSFSISGFVTTGFVETHLISLASDRGVSLQTAASAMGVLGLFNIFGTLAAGYYSDRIGRVRVLLAVYGLRGVAMLFLPFVAEPVGLYAFVVVFGLVNFAAVPPTSALASDLFGKELGASVFGWIAFSHQLGSALGVYVGALSYDALGSYQAAIAFSVVLILISIALVRELGRRTP